MMGDLCLRRETSHPGHLGACLRVEVCGVPGASVTILGKRVEPLSRPWSDPWNHAVSPRGAGVPSRACPRL